MCGIVGVVAHGLVNQSIYDALTVLQHRGQDAAGIVTWQDGELFLRKDNGLVRDVFTSAHMERLRGPAGIGHVRYPTAGCASSAEAQPLYVNSPYGMALAHNGNLTNADELRQQLFVEDRRHLNTSSDSEVLLNVLATELYETGGLTLDEEAVFAAIHRLGKRCRGAYACVALINGFGIVGFRDPMGIRPVCYGRRETQQGDEYIIASESVAVDALGFERIADIRPGEAVAIRFDGTLSRRQCIEPGPFRPCIFEHVYMARPDSILDDVYVYKARLRMGTQLALKIEREWADHDIDVVIPIPDTSRTAAMQLAHDLGVKYREGFIKNRYIGRTFIMPGQAMRRKSVRQKLNPIGIEFAGKNVLLVDDSIVRGTTSQEIIQMARDAGANKVYFASAAPPVRFPNVYGIDMPSATELVAHNRSIEEIAVTLGADRLIFQDLDALKLAVAHHRAEIDDFEDSVFSGNYVTADIDGSYLSQLELFRNDAARDTGTSPGHAKHVGLHDVGVG
ncbi:MAG: amidophosphoribosyltransferase [Oceanococcaceae bacterium]